MSADLLVAFAPAVGGAGLAVTVISYVRWLCKREDSREPLDNETRHLNHELVDVRSSVFAPNELVATLCVTCDKQFPPRLWEAKISAELAALERPKTVRSESAGPVSTTYVTVEPMIRPNAAWLIEARDAELESPRDSWSADDYRRRNWTTEILESNYDHGQRKYILPLFQRSRPGRVSRLTFENKAEASAWWRSCIPYDDFIAGRRRVGRVSGGIRSFTASNSIETVLQSEGRRLSEKIAELTGIPQDRVLGMSASEAQEAIRKATEKSVDQYAIRIWGEP